jgi:hypothetical protein
MLDAGYWMPDTGCWMLGDWSSAEFAKLILFQKKLPLAGILKSSNKSLINYETSM